MTCTDCQKASEQAWYGIYQAKCLQCCARMVKNARPSKRQQEIILQSLERSHIAPSREKILEEVRKND